MVVGVMLLLLFANLSVTADRPEGVPFGERQRYGFVATTANWPQSFDVARLRAGWYVDTTYPTCGFSPEGMDRALLLRTPSGYTVDPGVLGPLVDNHPGTLWLVGNEPDCINQDDLEPGEYAQIYHEVRSFIKDRDPTSLISPGGIVQPTPLRLQWLDGVLDAYRTEYGEDMPVDVWNIHNAILNEERGKWGADIPPGIDAEAGVIRDPQDNDNMDIFADQIWAFRQWMADNGYRDRPLIVTEYGILMPEIWYGFDAERVNAFMSATFDFFQTTTDGDLGYTPDDDRLVQRWAWFSLDVPPFDPSPNAPEGFNGNLFDPDTKMITAHGLHYAAHTASLPPLNYVDLVPGALRALPISDLASPTQSITRTLEVEVQNQGTLPSGSFSVTLEFSGPVSGTLERAVDGASPDWSRWVTFTLVDLQPGLYQALLEVDSGNDVIESTECDNQATGTFLAPTDRVVLPLVLRQSTPSVRHVSAALAHPSELLVSNLPLPRHKDQLQTWMWVKAGAQGKDRSPELDSTYTSLGPRPGLSAGLKGSLESAPAYGYREYEVPTGESFPAQIALDAQGRLWITELEGNKLAHFEPGTETWHEYEIPTPDSQPWGLAVDADGDIWFTETSADKIGRLDMDSGTITEPVTLTAGSEPWGVAASGTGAGTVIWFTERAGNKIGKFLPATGELTEYDLETPAAQPSGIAAHGNDLWFAETTGNKLGWLDMTDGEMREFASSPPFPPLRGPQDLAVMNSGVPWFTEVDGNNITFFYRSTLQYFYAIPIHTSASEPYGIATEGAAAVWFTERVANKLGRFTGWAPPAEYSLPTPNSLPTDIVVDSDGCAWYTAPGANRIGRLCLVRTYLPVIFKDSSADFER